MRPTLVNLALFAISVTAAPLSDALTSLAPRYDDGYNCDKPYSVGNNKRANSYAIRDGINYLRGLGGSTQAAPGCSRVSCSHGAGIFLCNDNAYYVEVAWWWVAEKAEVLQSQCAFGRECKGQFFDTGKFNVVVSGADC